MSKSSAQKPHTDAETDTSLEQLRNLLKETDNTGFDALSRLGDALTARLWYEAHVPSTQRYHCQRPRWALKNELRAFADTHCALALRDLGAIGFRESVDRALVTDVVNALFRLGNWTFYPNGYIANLPGVGNIYADAEAERGFDEFAQYHRAVWLPLRARFNALALTVEGALTPRQVGVVPDVSTRANGQKRKPGNPKNRFTPAQKSKYKKWLTEWKQKKNHLTLDAFLVQFPASERAEVKRGIKTAQKWESEKARTTARR